MRSGRVDFSLCACRILCTILVQFLSEKCPQPSLEMMLEGLREKEKRERFQQDKRDVCEEESEAEEISLDKGQNCEVLEPEESMCVPETQDESMCVPETQMKPTQKPNSVADMEIEGSASFIPVMSKSAQKRARQKAKRGSTSGESQGQSETVRSTSSSQSRGKEKRSQKIDMRAKQYEKMRREASLKKPLV
ncbi:hypothetical protein QQ045_012106 [Rhodiola kirilowii]